MNGENNMEPDHCNEDKYDIVADYCADILSFTEFDVVLFDLFKNFQRGEWVFVKKLFDRAGLTADDLFRKNALHGSGALPDDISESLVVCWLNNPEGLEDYATVVFFDYFSMSQSIAVYNKWWLMGKYQARQDGIDSTQ